MTKDIKSVEIEITINTVFAGVGLGLHMLGNGPHVLGNGPHVLGNGPHLCTQFMNWVILIMGRFGPIGLGNETHVLGNGPHCRVMGHMC